MYINYMFLRENIRPAFPQDCLRARLLYVTLWLSDLYLSSVVGKLPLDFSIRDYGGLFFPHPMVGRNKSECILVDDPPPLSFDGG